MEKNYKMVFVPQFGGSCEFVSYHESLNDAVVALNAVADYTLILHEASLMPDYSNAGMLFQRDMGYWFEIGDDGAAI